jgi:hypothetical protein
MSDIEKQNQPSPDVQETELTSKLEETAQKEIETSLEKLQIENNRLKQDLKEAQDVHELRKEYTGKLFWLIVLWLFAVITFVTLAGSTGLNPRFILADSVLIAFITSTTVSVLGLFVLVAKWLYPSHHKEEPEQKRDDKK